MKFKYLEENQVGCCGCEKYQRAYIIYWYYSSPFCVDCWCSLMDTYAFRFHDLYKETAFWRVKND